MKLACLGGKPVRDAYLPYGKQLIDDEDIKAVVEVLRSDYLTTGPSINLFEKRFCEYIGAKYAVAFANGTAALHAACFAAEIMEGDEVITTPLTFAASANCVLYTGGMPVFADINPLTYNIEPQGINKLINKKTRAIIPVDFTGQPCNLEKINQLAKENKLVIIEDAAHALGAEYKGKKVGVLSDMTMFSFHPVKHITTGEGGIITTNNDEYFEKLLEFRTHGITRDKKKLLQDEGDWYYEMQSLGYNYRITDIQAALGISQLQKLESFLEKRRMFAEMYNDSFKDMEEIMLPIQLEETRSSWHLYIIKLKAEKLECGRNEIFSALKMENIGVNVHYIPVYLHPYYQKLGYQKGLCPEGEKLYENIITLPLFPAMQTKDVEDVIKAVKKVIGFYAK